MHSCVRANNNLNMALSAIEPGMEDPRDYVDTDELRTTFAVAMSAMYRKEVPLYGTLIDIVQKVNNETLVNPNDPKVTALRTGSVTSERLDLERHGAIRLGAPYELRMVRRIFAIIGLYPVGYYDLSPAGLPMHATCFRPTTDEALKRNPFRVFTTLLRPDLLKDPGPRDVALALLQRRNIFSPELLELLDVAEDQGLRLTPNQARLFVSEAMKTFGWRPVAAASKQVYEELKEVHPILADIACFQSAHINHLTPRALDIEASQERMTANGLAVRERVEGPPLRNCPILLRQTSFLALEEPIRFPECGGALAEGSHKARFGEIEERGAAVTSKGRELYDCLMAEAMEKISHVRDTHAASEQDQILSEVFAQYPDTWDALRKEQLVHFTYRCREGAEVQKVSPGLSREDLLARGIFEAVPITYEDFLPLSAAGIFQSNLGKRRDSSMDVRVAFSNKSGLEKALGCAVKDSGEAYAEAQEASLRSCSRALGIGEAHLLSS